MMPDSAAFKLVKKKLEELFSWGNSYIQNKKKKIVVFNTFDLVEVGIFKIFSRHFKYSMLQWLSGNANCNENETKDTMQLAIQNTAKQKSRLVANADKTTFL